MKAVSLSLLALICIVFCGCPAYSAHPLYTDGDAVVEPGLEGTWVDSDGTAFLFTRNGAHDYAMVVSDPHSKYAQEYQVKLARLGDQIFMDLLFKEQTLDGNKLNDPIGVIPGHVVAKVDVIGDDLVYATLEDKPIEKQNALETAPLAYVTTEGGLFVTSETDALRRYVSTHLQDGFSDPDRLTRKRETADPSTRIQQ